jgi:hypothetical protein
MLAAGVGPGLPAGARCPACDGELAGRWWGYGRTVRLGGRVARLQIGRARCRRCRRTHALIPAFVVPRRLDGAASLLCALRAAAAGAGHRPIAARLRLPATTVRGWLRRLRARAGALAARLLALAGDLGGAHQARPPPGAGPLGALLGALEALGRAAAARLGAGGVPGAAELLVAAAGGALGAHTISP